MKISHVLLQTLLSWSLTRVLLHSVIWANRMRPRQNSFGLEAKGSIVFKKIILFIYLYFWLCWVFIALLRLSLVAVSRDYSSLRYTDFL